MTDMLLFAQRLIYVKLFITNNYNKDKFVYEYTRNIFLFKINF